MASGSSSCSGGDRPELLWCRVVSAIEVCGECENTEEGMSESGSVTV